MTEIIVFVELQRFCIVWRRRDKKKEDWIEDVEAHFLIIPFEGMHF